MLCSISVTTCLKSFIICLKSFVGCSKSFISCSKVFNLSLVGLWLGLAVTAAGQGTRQQPASDAAALSPDSIAQPSSGKDEQRRRIGWIDGFATAGATADTAATLHTSLRGLDPCGNPEAMVRLVACPADALAIEANTVRGPSGRAIAIPDAWKTSPETRWLCGVWMHRVRPGEDERQRWLARQPQPAAGSPWPVLAAADLPCDVVVAIDADGNWLVGCDLDLDLQLQPDERFRIPAGQRSRAHVFSLAGGVVAVQARATSADASAEFHLAIATLSGGSTSRWSSDWLPEILPWVVANSQPSAQWFGYWPGNGPADLTAAMHAAAKQRCELVLVNLQGRLRHRIDAVRLLAQLSRELHLPVVVNARTPISPEFLVLPARTTVPDIAEFAYRGVRREQVSFEAAVRDALAAPQRLQQIVRAAPLGGPETQAAHYARPLEAALSTKRFRPVKSIEHASVAGDRVVLAARIPLDAIDGRVVFPHVQAPFDSLATTMYDATGRRVSGSAHSNGVRYDDFPPLLSVPARGGYVLAEEKLFSHGRTFEATDGDVSLRWRRGFRPVHTTRSRPLGEQQVIALEGGSGGLDKVVVAPVHFTETLRGVDESEVPASVLAAAAPLLQRGAGVRRFWYREAPRHGDYTLRHLFQSEASARTWPNQNLQVALVYETGRMDARYHSIGDIVGFEPQRGWLLVQAAMPADGRAKRSDSWRASPPELLQRWPAQGPGGVSLAESSWHRVEDAPAELPRGNGAAAQKASIVRYRGRTPALTAGRGHVPARMWSEIRDGDPFSPVLGMVETRLDRSTRQQPSWRGDYANDVLAEMIALRRQQGQSAEAVLASVRQPAADSQDLVALRTYLLTLDQPELRKQHLEQVIAAAQRVLDLCAQRLGGLPAPADPYAAIEAATMGAPGPDAEVPEPYRMPTGAAGRQQYAWAVDAVYRQVRAIGYRELPDVAAQHPIADPAAQNEAYEAAFYQLCGMVDIFEPQFVLTLVRYHRRRGEAAEGYEALRAHAYEGPAMRWYFKKERDLFADLGSEPLWRLGHARWFLQRSGIGLP